MVSRGLSLAAGTSLLSLLWACGDSSQRPKTTPGDVGFLRFDAALDGGLPSDAGSRDGPVVLDSGRIVDGGGLDAGFPDGGFVDSGVDSGVATDSGVDSGVATDSGVDSGVATDTGVAVDMGFVDTGVVVDAGFVDAGAMPMSAGDLIITEIMKDPEVVGDTLGGEWFEVYNPGASALNLDGCILLDDDSDSHTVTSNLVVPAQSHFVFARSATPGFVPGYVYGGSIQLANGADEVVIRCGGILIDRVAYDDGVTFPDTPGASLNLDRASRTVGANDFGANWCDGAQSYNGDLGTPGADNRFCP